MADRPARVTALLGRGLLAPGEPVLRADDLGLLRGDGIFEALPVRDGQPWLLAEHLARLSGSARRMEIPLPSLEDLAGLIAQACTAWPAGTEGVLRLICTRGADEGGPATVYATIGEISPAILRMRAEGIRVLTATLGISSGVRAEAPWLLGGAKTLSYAVNMASQRWASAHGADDMLWVSTDGYALEGPTSSLVWLADDVLCTVPAEETGILPGVTVNHLLGRAPEAGFRAEHRMIRPAELSTVDGVWLVSSVRGPAEVRALDGQEMPETAHTNALRKLLGF